MAASEELVILKGGVSVLLPAIQLALRLEQDFTMTVDEDGHLVVQPSNRLTPADCVLIRRYREELKRIVEYEAPTCA